MFNPVTTCPACQSFADTINGILSDIDSLQEDLKNATDPEKPGIINMIRDDRKQLGEPRRQLAQCELQNACQQQPSRTVPALISATVTIWISGFSIGIQSPENGMFSNVSLNFAQEVPPVDPNLWGVFIPSLTIPFDGGLTASLRGTESATGSFTLSTREMDLSVPLHITGIPFIDGGDRDATPDLSTQGSISTPDGQINGSPVDDAGNLTLVGFDDPVMYRVIASLSNLPPA